MSEEQEQAERESRSQMYKHEDIFEWLKEEGALTDESTGPEIIAAFAANRNRYRKTERYANLVRTYNDGAEARAEEARAAKEAAKAAKDAEREQAKAAKAAEKEAAKAEREAAAKAKAEEKAAKESAKTEPVKAEKPAAKAAKKGGKAAAATEENPFD